MFLVVRPGAPSSVLAPSSDADAASLFQEQVGVRILLDLSIFFACSDVQNAFLIVFFSSRHVKTAPSVSLLSQLSSWISRLAVGKPSSLDPARALGVPQVVHEMKAPKTDYYIEP